MAWTKDQCTQLSTAVIDFPERNNGNAYLQVFYGEENVTIQFVQNASCTLC
jgi:hypothetical protein